MNNPKLAELADEKATFMSWVNKELTYLAGDSPCLKLKTTIPLDVLLECLITIQSADPTILKLIRIGNKERYICVRVCSVLCWFDNMIRADVFLREHLEKPRFVATPTALEDDGNNATEAEASADQAGIVAGPGLDRVSDACLDDTSSDEEDNGSSDSETRFNGGLFGSGDDNEW